MERKQNPHGGDKNLDDNTLFENIINEINSNLKGNIALLHNRRNRDNELVDNCNKGDIEIIFSEYVFPLVADCNMPHCPHGGTATGYIFKDKTTWDKWCVEFECPEDGFFQSWTHNIERLVDTILSDELNFVKIL